MKTPAGKRLVPIRTIGIENDELEVLRRIFALSAERRYSFHMASAADEVVAEVALLDLARPGAADAWREACAANGRDRPVPVVVAEHPPAGCTYHARRPMTATRMLGLLERIVEERLLAPGGLPPAAVGDLPAGDTVADGGVRHRALVVDQSPLVLEQVGDAFDAEDVDADYACTGEQALALLRDEQYDIVFFDLKMPDFDGYAVCRDLKSDHERRPAPVVILVGKSSPFEQVKGRLAGCDDYLNKPVGSEDFLAALVEHLRDAPPADESGDTAANPDARTGPPDPLTAETVLLVGGPGRARR